MTSPKELSPQWDHNEVAGFVRSSSAIVDLGHPAGAPHAPCTTLYLDIVEDEDLVEFAWRFATTEEESNFGEATYGSGRSSDLQQAEMDCWIAVVAFLVGEGFSDEEIAEAV